MIDEEPSERCPCCKGKPCHCDELYDIWKDRQLERESDAEYRLGE